MPNIPLAPTRFEDQARVLKLTEHTYAASERLRRWCEQHKDHCYIPEWLLKEWGILSDPE